jgi:metallophosphoesterase superfamily enzyme
MSEQKTETLSNVAIDSDLHKELKIYCATHGVTIKRLIEESVTKMLAKVYCKSGEDNGNT